MKFGLKEIRTKMGLFDFDVLCVVGQYEKAMRYIRWKFEEPNLSDDYFDVGYEPRGRTFFRPGYVPVIWIPKKPRGAREYATLAHEAHHAVSHMMDWAGLRRNDDTEEVITHAMAHIINNILANLK